MKPLSKINDEIASLVGQVLEIEAYEAKNDFNIRENHVVANIRVHDWIDEDDVLKVLKTNDDLNLKDEILEEFDEERLNSIHNHVCSMEVEYLKEKYEGRVHLNDYYKQATQYARFLNGLEVNEFYKTEFEKFSKRKHNTKKDYLKYLKANHKWEFEQLDKLNSFEPDCWQYGRSGGWFSICETSELEGQEFESYDFYADISYLEGIDDNNEFNRVLNEELDVCSINKREFLRELEEFVENWQFRFESISYFVEEIEESTKYFKECLLQQLEHEIDEFIEHELEVEQSNVRVSLKDNKVVTSLGVKVEQKEFIDALKRNLNLFTTLNNVGDKVDIKEKVGGYFVEYAKKIEDDILIKAGCHKFSFNNLRSIL